MKFMLSSSALILVLLSSVSALSATADPRETMSSSFSPHRISFSDLKSSGSGSDSSRSNDAFLDALTQVGMVAVKDIPNYGTVKDKALAAIHGCTTAAAAASTNNKVEVQCYADGTVRQTLATHTIPGPGGAKNIFNGGVVAKGCNEFIEASGPLRDIIAVVIQVFADRLGSIYADADTDTTPLLSTQGGTYNFHTIGDIVKNGEHLEHFHSYQRNNNGSNNKEEGNTSDKTILRGRKTIDFHVDQGLFIAFTPGMIASTETNREIRPVDSSTSFGGFYIQQEDGTSAKVAFEGNDLVFMLGDGVNQYINPHISKQQSKSKSNEKNTPPRLLRAAPHALVMPNHEKNEARVWHGRMVLPPPGAVHPAHGKTFHELRRLMIESTNNSNSKDHHHQDEYINIGCSSPTASARLLSAGDHDGEDGHTTCEEGTLFCWFRCMDLETFGVSEEICASQGKRLQCTNPRDLIADGSDHGDYYPGCTNSEQPDEPYPRLPAESGYPRDEVVCLLTDFESFAAGIHTDVAFARDADGSTTATPKSYEHVFDLGKAKFMWSVKDGMVDGRLAFNGLFGYLAWGIAGPPGSKKNGMHEASIIMALPGDDYSAVDGLDLSLDPTVQEYKIHPTDSAFRNWMTPIEGRDTSTYSVESNTCFTAISFKTDSINGIKFNLEGKDELLWAANSEDYYAGFHGRNQRARFSIDWSTGEAALFAYPQVEEEQADDHVDDRGVHADDHSDGHDDHTHTHSDTSAAAVLEATKWMAATVAAILLSAVTFM